MMHQEEQDYLYTYIALIPRVGESGYNPSAPFNDGWGSEDTPSAPKKQKVEHKEESSDDSSVEPKAS